jgi:hypothetical protein
MIIIDFLEEVLLTNNEQPDKPISKWLPRLYEAESFFILPTEYRDNENNTEMSAFNRYMVTRVTYSIWASVAMHGGYVDMLVKEYNTEAEAVKDYDAVIEAVGRGDRTYSFRRTEPNGN